VRFAAVLLALACGCGGSVLKAQAGAIGDVIANARDNGAERCAPVELAMAESHHDFALQELSEGNYFQAKNELRVAEDNAHRALSKSPRQRCNPGTRVATPTDSDGDGILDKVDRCPEDPEDFDEFEDEDGCPDPDNDKDGIPDVDDKCPNDPEDKDGFEDEDGCPDSDNDADGLADSIDQCPDQAEDSDGYEDDDGCPDCDNDGDGVPECPEVVDKCPDKPAKTKDGCPEYKLVKVTDKKIELRQTVYFDTARASIKRVSYPLLNEVAQVLDDNPKIKVRIEGHTDSRGKDAYNLRLSDDRAASVRRYLAQRGIDESRMVSKGYGERVPIADNRTKTGRGQNRRVEFVITGR
jgi:outer membrane protein OmpA-like peptidoglycan-associated protein